MGECLRKGIQNLYTELILTMIVVAFGTILLSSVRGVQPPSSPPDKVSNVAAYVINGSNKVIIANWGEEKEEVDLVCVMNNGSITTESVIVEPNSTVVEETMCEGDMIVALDGDPVPTFIISP